MLVQSPASNRPVWLEGSTWWNVEAHPSASKLSNARLQAVRELRLPVVFDVLAAPDRAALTRGHRSTSRWRNGLLRRT